MLCKWKVWSHLRNLALVLSITAVVMGYLAKIGAVDAESTKNIILLLFIITFPVFGISLIPELTNEDSSEVPRGLIGRFIIFPVERIINGIVAIPKFYLGAFVVLFISSVLLVSEVNSLPPQQEYYFGPQHSAGFFGGLALFCSLAIPTYARKAHECIKQTQP